MKEDTTQAASALVRWATTGLPHYGQEQFAVRESGMLDLISQSLRPVSDMDIQKTGWSDCMSWRDLCFVIDDPRLPVPGCDRIPRLAPEPAGEMNFVIEHSSCYSLYLNWRTAVVTPVAFPHLLRCRRRSEHFLNGECDCGVPVCICILKHELKFSHRFVIEHWEIHTPWY